MELTTKFNIGDKVKLQEYDIKGTVMEFAYDRSGLTYRVKYFYNGELKSLWVEEDYMKPLNDSDNNSCGFLINGK